MVRPAYLWILSKRAHESFILLKITNFSRRCMGVHVIHLMSANSCICKSLLYTKQYTYTCKNFEFSVQKMDIERSIPLLPTLYYKISRSTRIWISVMPVSACCGKTGPLWSLEAKYVSSTGHTRHFRIQEQAYLQDEVQLYGKHHTRSSLQET